MELLPEEFFARDAVTVARELLGKVIKKVEDPEHGEEGVCEGIIVETEAYGNDPASHAVKKPVQGRLMCETYGRWYVYFTYGMHWCANVTCDAADVGAVLIRAVEPVAGLAAMRRRRGADGPALCRGPACFTQAFGIGKRENGLPLSPTFGIFKPTLTGSTGLSDFEVVASPRIGISQATKLPWRFYIRDNPFVSKLPKSPRA